MPGATHRALCCLNLDSPHSGRSSKRSELALCPAKQASVLDAADGRDEPVLQFTARKAAVHLGSLHGVSLRPFRPHVRKNLNARFMPLAIQKPCPEREGP